MRTRFFTFIASFLLALGLLTGPVFPALAAPAKASGKPAPFSYQFRFTNPNDFTAWLESYRQAKGVEAVYRLFPKAKGFFDTMQGFYDQTKEQRENIEAILNPLFARYKKGQEKIETYIATAQKVSRTYHEKTNTLAQSYLSKLSLPELFAADYLANNFQSTAIESNPLDKKEMPFADMTSKLALYAITDTALNRHGYCLIDHEPGHGPC